MYNIISLVLGLVGIVLPIYAMFFKTKSLYLFSCFSLSSCILSLYFQLLEYNRLVGCEDFVAMMDTSDTLIKVAGVLVCVTIVVNVIGYLKNRK